MIQVNKRFLMQDNQMRLKLFVMVQEQADDVEVVHEGNVDSALPPIPEVSEDEWDIRPGFFEEDEEEEDTGPYGRRHLFAK